MSKMPYPSLDICVAVGKEYLRGVFVRFSPDRVMDCMDENAVS